MLRILDNILSRFHSVFTYDAAFNWFVIVIIGFIVRFDHMGISSFIRWLYLDPVHYDALLLFFRTSSWTLNSLLIQWISMTITLFPVIEFNSRLLLIGDGIKISKEAFKMPCVKKLHQHSSNSSKGQKIWGHHFGYIGLLAGNQKKRFCVPLYGQLHEGVEIIRPEEGINSKPATIVTRMANLAIDTAEKTGNLCYIALDAYFSTGPMFTILKNAVDDKGKQIVHIITRAKSNYVGYTDREFAGAEYDDEDKFKLMDWFDFPEFFTTLELNIYNESKIIEYYRTDLLWRPIDDFIRFVCVKDGEGKYVLMCSDLNLSPKDIIMIYSYRSKAEVMFLFLKHLIGGFCYRFWTKSMPKLNRKIKTDLSTLDESGIRKVR
ncbi:MAG: transposase, partial [Deltaproteobacteria bacterium]|nr:transposase [Deltaproteobacteria bacterium]